MLSNFIKKYLSFNPNRKLCQSGCDAMIKGFAAGLGNKTQKIAEFINDYQK